MRAVLALPCLLAAMSVSGCAVAVLGTAGAVGLTSVQEKTMGEAVDDATASNEIKAKLLNESGARFVEAVLPEEGFEDIPQLFAFATEENTVYSVKPGQWFLKAPSSVVTSSETLTTPADTRPIAENILALIISPQVTADDAALKKTTPWWIAPNYAYDSTQLLNATTDSPQGTQHMLPPRVAVTLVAIDEASARKLALKYPDTMPQLIPPGAFTLADNKQQDLKNLATKLRDEQLNYQVFSTTISMRNSKWGLLR
ncbi:MAG: hypothetical protein B7Z22_10905 [Hyphomonas sp. 32-62-5]|nr:MAG: hypothetical protein B7Z22_10905 [Hyphomonas sp. 32-62-5]